MDPLPVDALKTVQSFLPWKNRLIARQLSSKFLSPPYSKDELESFFLREEKDSFCLTLHWDDEDNLENERIIESEEIKSEEKRRAIEIFMRPAKMLRDIVILQTTAEEKGIVLLKTTIICPTVEQYHGFVDTYIQLIFSHFSIWSLYLFNLSSRFLTKIDASRLRDNVHPRLTHDLEFHTSNTILTTEEKQLLDWSKENYNLHFVSPVNFQVTPDFWDIVSINHLTLDFGGLYRKGVVLDVDLGINDDFISKRMATKGKEQLGFRAMNISSVSTNFIIKYCQKAYVRGFDIMFCLSLAHRFNSSDISSLKDRLYADGFLTICENSSAVKLAKVVDVRSIRKGEGSIIETRQTKSGYDPDQIVVIITNEKFEIYCDYECYRGKISIDRRIIKN